MASIWGENMLGYSSLDIICFSWLTVFLELRSKKTVRYSEQVMSVDKYPSVFSPQMEVIVFIILQIFIATRAVLKTGEYFLVLETIIFWFSQRYDSHTQGFRCFKFRPL